MLRKCVISVVLILLILSLLVPIVTLAKTQDKVLLPDLAFLQVTKSAEQVDSMKVRIKDGHMYLEVADQLYVIDALLETILPILEEALEKAPNTVETHEVSEEMLDGHRTVHYQVFSKKTGLLESESWQALDLPLSLALKSISYDPEGNVLSTTQIVDIELNPDFSEFDFSKALPFPEPPGLQQAIPLTPQEFKEMVPWYDLSLPPLPSYELTKIDHMATFGSSRFTLTYSTDPGQPIRVMIFGDQKRLVETHAPSEFDLILRVKFGDLTLEPAMRSSRTDVMVGISGSISRSDGNIFLQNVVIHPTLQ